MARFTPNYPVPVSDLVTDLLDPVMRKRAGISVGLVQSWEEIVGPRLAATSRPQKIQWPQRVGQDDPFEPATLIIACEGLAALHIQHETSEIISRVNGFLGFNAIGRIKIVQKPVRTASAAARPKLAPLTEADAARLAGKVSQIEDEGLRTALERLGRSVIGAKRQKR
jgi:hypothetical protein